MSMTNQGNQTQKQLRINGKRGQPFLRKISYGDNEAPPNTKLAEGNPRNKIEENPTHHEIII